MNYLCEVNLFRYWVYPVFTGYTTMNKTDEYNLELMHVGKHL